MPPVISPRKDVKTVLSYDPAAYVGKESHKLIITDISFGVSDKVRDNGCNRYSL